MYYKNERYINTLTFTFHLVIADYFLYYNKRLRNNKTTGLFVKDGCRHCTGYNKA